MLFLYKNDTLNLEVKKVIDIIVPAYNSYDTIDIPLLSLSTQSIAKKLNVYIVNDGSEKSYANYVRFYKNFFNSIKELKIKANKGSGFARKYGLKHSNAEFIVFLDSDDCLYYPFAIEKLYNQINDNKSDIVISNVLEEMENNNFIVKNYPIEYLHGKIYRRSYLKKNNINFDDSRLMEDILFNKTIFLQNPKITNLDSITYVWKNSKNSLTRKENFIFETIGIYIENNLCAIKNALKGTPNKEKISECIYECITYFYLCYICSPEKKYFTNAFKLFNDLIDLYEKFPIDEFKKKYVFSQNFNDLINYYYIDILKILDNKTSLNELIEMARYTI